MFHIENDFQLVELERPHGHHHGRRRQRRAQHDRGEEASNADRFVSEREDVEDTREAEAVHNCPHGAADRHPEPAEAESNVGAVGAVRVVGCGCGRTGSGSA